MYGIARHIFKSELRVQLFPACVATYPARVLHLCPAVLMPEVMTLSPVPRCQPVESHLEVL